MANFMNRSFSRREKILLLVLTLIGLVGLYFYLVHYPVTTQLAQIEEQRTAVADDTVIAQARQQVYLSMKAELEEIFSMPEDEITVMPKYDNIKALMREFNVIFDGADPELSFDPVTVEDGVAVRVMRFTFTSDYKRAKDILEQLTGTGYRCLLDSLSITPEEGNLETDVLQVSGTITFYEQAD